MSRWDAGRAADWYARAGWICDFNYLPRTAVNWTGQWQEETFDPGTWFQRERIGCFHRGLVKGRTQTHLPWPPLMSLARERPGLWFHDLLDESYGLKPAYLGVRQALEEALRGRGGGW